MKYANGEQKKVNIASNWNARASPIHKTNQISNESKIATTASAQDNQPNSFQTSRVFQQHKQQQQQRKIVLKMKKWTWRQSNNSKYLTRAKRWIKTYITSKQQQQLKTTKKKTFTQNFSFTKSRGLRFTYKSAPDRWFTPRVCLFFSYFSPVLSPLYCF